MDKTTYPLITAPAILNEIQAEDFDIQYYIYEEDDSFLSVVSPEEQVSYVLKRCYSSSLWYFKAERSKTPTADVPTVGSSERIFADYIRKHSNRLTVLENRRTRHYRPKGEDRYLEDERTTNHYYYPDLLVVDEGAGMIFDIEIDEPYSYKSGLPTHFLNFIKKERSELWCNDEQRDEYFASEGIWTVRFAEEQIVKHPRACLELIDSIVVCHQSNIVGSDFAETLRHWSKEMFVKRWTYDDACLMAEQKYRDTYLPNNAAISTRKVKWGLPTVNIDEVAETLAMKLAKKEATFKH